VSISLVKKAVVLLLFFCIAATGYAQEIYFKDTIAAYNTKRLNTNKKGMKVLGAWGLTNIAASTVGYFTANTDEWKYFHEMNVLWGVVNTGIAGLALGGVRKEMAATLTYQQAYNRYVSTKRLYLINAGLDVLYIGTGIGLNEYGATAKKDAAIFKGFGKSLVVQGVFLLLFDNVMFASHQRQNTKWYRIMNEIRITNNGVGYIHTF
jgi:hypothetical protein